MEDVIHNKVFMHEAYSRGVVKVDSIEDIPDNSVVMFSTHGTPPSVISRADAKSLTVVDSTCPIVSEIHQSVKNSVEKKKKIVIVGDPNHTELIGLFGHIPPSDLFVVSKESDVDLLPEILNSQKVVCYTQTTLDIYETENIIESIKKRFPDIECKETTNICLASRERQKAIFEVSKIVDLVLIFGSSYSSNTLRMVDVAKRSGGHAPVHLLETKEDIKIEWFDNVESFAVSSGASCPESVIEESINYLIHDNNLDIVLKDFSL
jgi:4-hydroxy-3-methylbut-2-enyl diphosphate reductase